ncbi:WD domain-containing protein [Histoplasma capsulatum G186AR]|uniref:WD domain-containing protein n=2 Tax=Ajellomyces capsulatus TaxID=5037 RepID=C0NK88_AJECG|nr:WD domain-containing protein [Histoplasma capsulatum G186AR]EEH08279.1 WD domain-containing protein [Histoplasma capsulatum G186AR]
MAQSSHRDDFFQTTTSLEESRRKAEKARNSNGHPIKLQSKLLAIAADPTSDSSVYVAESAGLLRKVVLETGETATLYRGPTAPLTSICFSSDGTTIFAGCWDKTIWSWDVTSRTQKHRYHGHTDFVKTVISQKLDGDDLLISGGADGEIIIWNISAGKRSHVFKDYSRGVLHLAVDPLVSEEDLQRINVFSAGSDRSIRYFSLSTPFKEQSLSAPILEHETSVYKLFFDADGDLWTASADKTAKCLSREANWQADMTLDHPDFVRDVAVCEQGGWVVTGCRDEEVRVWNRATGKLHHSFSGHFEEVTGILILGTTVVSVSIDATIRQWSLDPTQLEIAKAKAERASQEDEVIDDGLKESLLTEEEERELAGLMGDD